MTSESSKQGNIEIFLDGQYLGIGAVSVTQDFDHTGPGFGPPKSTLLVPPRIKLNIEMTNRFVLCVPGEPVEAAWERIRGVFGVGVDPAKANETSKTVSKADERLEPGIGYRFLDKEELVVEGDELWWPANKCWALSGNYCRPNPRQAYNTTYRRRNQFAEGELVQIIKPATQALQTAYPGWVTRGGKNMDGFDGKILECPPSRALGQGKRGIDVELGRWWVIDVDWLAPASSKQKAAFQAEKDKKAKVQELEDKMKAIESELAILKGT